MESTDMGGARGQADGNGVGAEANRLASVVRYVDQSWLGSLDAPAGISEERLTEVGAVGEWSIKDVMGHVPFWDDQAFDIRAWRKRVDP